MERHRRREPKSTSSTEEFHQIQKYKALSSISSDSSSSIDGSTRDHKFTLELGQGASGRFIGRPVTKLLAEMYKGMKPKRQSPNSISRLMGIEKQPSREDVSRQQRRKSRGNQKKSFLTDIPSNRQFYRRSSMGQQELKDACEDLQASHFRNRRLSSKWSAQSMLTKSEMALIQQKFIDARHCSTDEKLQGSKELDDTLDKLDSKDLSAEYFRQPDSFSVDKLHDLRVKPRSSHGSRIAVLKPLNHAMSEDNAEAWISKRDSSSKHISHLKHEDGLLLEPKNCHRAHTSHKHFEEKNEKKMLPRRIVVLKPNLENMQKLGISGSSHDHSSGYGHSFRKMNEYPSEGGGEKVSWRKTDSSCDLGFSDGASEEAREIAREITTRVRDVCDEIVDAKSSGFKGYAGDESSFDAQESDSDSESEMFKLPSRNSLSDGNKSSRYPSSGSVESFVNREAKKKLSERWKITQEFQDLEIVAKGSTLREMLATPDGHTSSLTLNTKKSLGRASTQLDTNSESAKWEGPLGISSREGWKDGIHGNSSRSRSLPPVIGRRNRRGSYYDVLVEEKHLMPADITHHGRSKVGRGNQNHKEIFTSQASKSKSKKSLPCQHINDIDPSAQADFEIQMEANIKDACQQPFTFHLVTEADSSESLLSNVVTAEHESTTLSSESYQLHPGQSSVVDNDKAASYDQVNFSLQELHNGPHEDDSASLKYLGSQLGTSESSNEADHASPVSVLKVPFTEYASSSSESFERISIELHELRMQLQLLQMESGAYPEAFTLVPMEKDVAQVSSMFPEGSMLFGAEGWEASYALDVLIRSGFQEVGYDVRRIMWHSPDCPLDPGLFENLEKNYDDENFGSKSERKLLFDRINFALLEIFVQHVDLYPWVKPKLAGLHATQQKERVRGALEKLINQESATWEVTERLLDREMQWSDSKGEIDMIGNEIEELLMDDMITEFLLD